MKTQIESCVFKIYLIWAIFPVFYNLPRLVEYPPCLGFTRVCNVCHYFIFRSEQSFSMNLQGLEPVVFRSENRNFLFELGQVVAHELISIVS